MDEECIYSSAKLVKLADKNDVNYYNYSYTPCDCLLSTGNCKISDKFEENIFRGIEV